VRVVDVIGVAATTIVEDTVAIATMNDVTEEAGGMITVEDVVIVTVITGVVLGLAVALRVIVVVAPLVTAAAAVPAALDIVEGIMMTVVPLTAVGLGLGIMIGDMNVIVDTEMGGREMLRDGKAMMNEASCCY